MQILRAKPPGTRFIIFCSTKRMCDQLAGNLGREFNASSIHGDKRQQVPPTPHPTQTHFTQIPANFGPEFS